MQETQVRGHWRTPRPVRDHGNNMSTTMYKRGEQKTTPDSSHQLNQGFIHSEMLFSVHHIHITKVDYLSCFQLKPVWGPSSILMALFF